MSVNAGLNGIYYLLNGFELIFHPKLRRFIIYPVLISILFFSLLFWGLQYFVTELNQWVMQFLPSWLMWLSYLIWIAFFVSFAVIFIFTFVMVANLVLAPFNSYLSEQVEIFLGGELPEVRSLWDNIKDIPRIVGRQLSILLYYLPRALLILLLFIIPVVQIIAPFLSFLFHGWIMSLTYLDYPTDNHRIPMSQVRQWLRERYWLGLGFGIAVLVLSCIPGLNFFVIPAAVAGATKCWVEQNQR